MRRAAMLSITSAATAALAFLLLPAEAVRVFPRRKRQAKAAIPTAGQNGTTSYASDHNRTLAIHGYGNSSAGVAAFDVGILFPEDKAAVVPDLYANATEGTGPGAPVGYCLVENQPRCYFQLGSAYCPAPGTVEHIMDSCQPILSVILTPSLCHHHHHHKSTNQQRLVPSGPTTTCLGWSARRRS